MYSGALFIPQNLSGVSAGEYNAGRVLGEELEKTQWEGRIGLSGVKIIKLN